jgi:hypothetical protein
MCKVTEEVNIVWVNAFTHGHRGERVRIKTINRISEWTSPNESLSPNKNSSFFAEKFPMGSFDWFISPSFIFLYFYFIDGIRDFIILFNFLFVHSFFHHSFYFKKIFFIWDAILLDTQNKFCFNFNKFKYWLKIWGLVMNLTTHMLQ